ncbi:MAG: hypothetical protein A2015_04450 [Spirochaetes bacterium GWF1_31_7]|nr:MAG: hypothetical protein A2Y30_16820 [Spirochaetes bacterium GWE1_32_154]OHD51596.1 MAG: hypothetical protein A2Y29_07565 [Spirochaetes bacterium GWE2_31_10]OHD52970.1 MAG: hypothetical protein A2015_04450 [Spirochaetes bacterium GWF1_31_7]OHD82218.1 MAG: hypothetical protein A2355_12500 [Spirochaetes bacterium RIFOXYB1_FULL_32_8]HBD93715.1 hypothetical protein [Spirochaetia bacterium]
MKKFLLIVSLSLMVNMIFSFDFKIVDDLNHNGNHTEALKMLKQEHNNAAPDAGIIWRTARAQFEIAESLDKSKKNEKIAQYTEAMEFLKPYLDIQTGAPTDRAHIAFYYATNLGSRSKVIGISESLETIPDLKKYADKAISIDPSMASAYFLKAKIEEGVPSFLGGDKFTMGELFFQAITNNPSDLTIVFDAASAFYDRNWDSKKKTAMSQKIGTKTNDFIIKDDRSIAKELIENGIKTYKTLTNPSKREKNQYTNMMALLTKFK